MNMQEIKDRLVVKAVNLKHGDNTPSRLVMASIHEFQMMDIWSIHAEIKRLQGDQKLVQLLAMNRSLELVK